MHSLIGIFEVTAASGHSTQTNLDSYLDNKNVARTIPVTLSLHGEQDVHAEVINPSLDGIVGDLTGQSKDQVMACVHRLFDEMFKIDVSNCKRGGTKWGIMELCGLSMIFHLLDVSKHTTN